MMINPKKLIKMARKWQKVAVLRRKRISQPGFNTSVTVADKGHFVVYTTDGRRFTFPISYLSNHIFQELLKMSEEEYGLPSNGPITLPCDAIFMEYAVSLIQGCVSRNLYEAFLNRDISGIKEMSHLSSQATIAFVHKEKGDSLNTNNILEQKNGSEMPRSAKACNCCNHDRLAEVAAGG
ncbi:hypothetical protein EZV62_024382 [Acer yangbiense]|uniref:Auxin-responsive protein n=1 Tax=Acer yangbiense TaxID=1000413 RepID=A0A5C7GVL5_9ROSI|nr:hypothetical protein EZV62_024382 [Acer yangbiense]